MTIEEAFNRLSEDLPPPYAIRAQRELWRFDTGTKTDFYEITFSDTGKNFKSFRGASVEEVYVKARFYIDRELQPSAVSEDDFEG